MTHETHSHHCDSCDCANPRRDFIRQAAVLAAGMIAGSGVVAAAGKLPVALGASLARAGDEITYPIPASDGVTIDRENAVILVRMQGKVMAFNWSCPHQNAAVRWRQAEMKFECSKHDSVYAADGTYVGGRATRNMDRFAIKRSGNAVIVNVAQMIESDAQKAAWDAAVVKV